MTSQIDAGIGKLVVQPWEEPADVIEQFLFQALRAGHNLSQQAVGQLVEFFCARRACSRVLKQLELEVTGIGKLIVEPWHDPADIVQDFLRQATAAGAGFEETSVQQIMQYFCSRRSCQRQLADVVS